MKWPASITSVRHVQSRYNILKDLKRADPEYQEFVKAFEEDHTSLLSKYLAQKMRKKYALGTSDMETDITDEGRRQGVATGRKIGTLQFFARPDVILVSPAKRTKKTLEAMVEGGFDVKDIPIVEEDRIREQEHGLSLIYSDWRVFQVYHPVQKELRDMLGPYWYQYPQGESVLNVRDRLRSVTEMIIREYAGKHVMMFTHHLTKLALRTNWERLPAEEFLRLDIEEKPVNCGVTIYRGNPDLGKAGKLELMCYNEKLY